MTNPALTSKPNFPHTRLIALCFILFAFSLNLSLLCPGAYHSDAIGFAKAITLSLKTGHIHPLHGHGYPFTAVLGVIVYACLNFFGIADPVFSINILSAFCSALCVGLTFLIGQRLFNTWTGILSAALLALNPIFLGTSLYGNSHMPALCLFLISIFLLGETLTTPRLILSGLCLGLSLASRIQDTAPTCFAYLFLIATSPKTSFKKYSRGQRVLPLITAFVATIAIYAIILKTSFLSKFLWHVQTDTSFIFDWKKNILFAFKNLRPAFSLSGFLLLAIGTLWGLAKHKRLILLLYLWILPSLFLASTLNFSTPRFFIPCLVPLAFLITFPFSQILKTQRTSLRVLTLTAYLCFVSIPFIHILLDLQQRHNRDWTQKWVLWIKSQTPDNAKIVATDLKHFLNYYGVPTLDRPQKTDITSETLKAFEKSINQNIDAGIPVYITNLALFSYDPNHTFARFIKSHFTLSATGSSYPLERWHRGCLTLDIIFADLIRIDKKQGD